jgi:hypothetical protein
VKGVPQLHDGGEAEDAYYADHLGVGEGVVRTDENAVVRSVRVVLDQETFYLLFALLDCLEASA